MKRIILYILTITIISAGAVRGESPDQTGALGNLFARLKTSDEDSVRIRINDSIRVYIENYVRLPTLRPFGNDTFGFFFIYNLLNKTANANSYL